MSDSFMHKHQASLDSQREEAEINWLFPEPDNDEILERFFEEAYDEIKQNNYLEFDEEEYRRPVHKQNKYGEVSLGLVINQDAYNLPFVQKGMQSEGYEGLWIGDQELRIRHFHDTLENYLNEDSKNNKISKKHKKL